MRQEREGGARGWGGNAVFWVYIFDERMDGRPNLKMGKQKMDRDHFGRSLVSANAVANLFIACCKKSPNTEMVPRAHLRFTQPKMLSICGTAPSRAMHLLPTQRHILQATPAVAKTQPMRLRFPALGVTTPHARTHSTHTSTGSGTPNKKKQRAPKLHKLSTANTSTTAGPSLAIAELWTKLVSGVAKGVLLFTLAAGLAFFGTTKPAEAARSGGRIGGSSFGRSSSFLSSGSSFGGGSFGGGGFGGGSMGSRHRMMSPYHSMSGLGMHPYRSSVSTNAFFFSPFGLGYGVGYPRGGGGGGVMSLLFWGVFALIMVQAVRGVLGSSGGRGLLSDSGASSSSGNGGGGYYGASRTGERLTVAKVQVGLLGTARELQRDLERIASRADTSTSKGLHYVLQETVLALMRNPNYCVYGFAKAGVEYSADEAEARFNKLSLEERAKFEKETRVNVAGRRAQSTLGLQKDLAAPVSELIVVTIVVAAEGKFKLPKVSGRKDLIEALTTLGAVPASEVLAVEVLWTPEEEDDYFTQEDLAADYPLMVTL